MTLPLCRFALALGTLTLLAACGGGGGDKATQTAAKVNKEEITIHQINFVVERQPGLKQDQLESTRKVVLERLIDQELAVQMAEEQKLDRDPRVVQQVEAAKREILARAYVEKIGSTAVKPSKEEISKYYAANPALFAERRIYSLQEISIEAKPEQLEALRAQLTAAKNINEFLEYLKANDIRFAGNQAVRAAEQLPLNSLATLAQMKDGQSLLSRTANGLQVLMLAGSRNQPVTEEQARPSIEAFLLNLRKSELVTSHVKDLRGSAKIEYLGKYAPGPGAAASAAASGVAPATPVAPAVPPAPVASGLDANAISKGMGLK